MPKEEKLKDIICCNQPVFINRDAEYEGIKGVGVWCDKCGLHALHEDEKTCIDIVKESIKAKEKKEQEAGDSQGELDMSRGKDQKPPAGQKKKENKKVNKQTQTALAVIPKNPRELESYFHDNQTHLIEITSPVIGDRSAMERLISNNMRYVQNAKQLEKVWGSIEGQESIIHETEEAMMMGAELGKMGDLVPYGKICEFIPSVEAYEFSLTNGKNAPFQNITIECIHENDIALPGRKDGDFFLNFDKMGIPRGVVKAVAVYGILKKTGNVIGEVYDKERLMEKAEAHSTSYRYFLQDKNRADQLRTEGKLKTMNGREYFEKDMPGSNGPWKKKIFLDELSNPYEGADQPEMLRKSAGKSFMRKYARVRNSEAAMDEVRSHKKTVDKAFDLADEQYVGE